MTVKTRELRPKVDDVVQVGYKFGIRTQKIHNLGITADVTHTDYEVKKSFLKLTLSINLHMHLPLIPPSLGVLKPPGTGCSQLMSSYIGN